MNYSINLIKSASPPHYHAEYETIICVNGKGVFHYQEGDINVEPGTIIIVPPYTVHSSVCENEYERIYINGSFGKVFSFNSVVVVTENREQEGTLLAKMIYRNRYAEKDFVSSLAVTFAQFLIQNLKYDSEISLAVKDIISKITEGFYDSNLDLKTILTRSGYAEDYVRAKFKEFTRNTPVEFLTETRIKHACFLMDIYAKSMPLSEVAELCGFSDYVYFSRKFKMIKGISPRQYMKLKNR